MKTFINILKLIAVAIFLTVYTAFITILEAVIMVYGWFWNLIHR